MSAADELLKQRRAELARKFLERSHQEAVVFLARLAEARPGAPIAGASDFKMFAHKIRGTGATLGMDSLSDLAGELEALLAKHGAGSPSAADFEALNSAAQGLFQDIERLLG
jgi:hypothetical protein